jgi:N-acetyl-gamma-glutamyl-phosphate reductase
VTARHGSGGGLRAAVIGAAGYAGGELLRLLLQHPAIESVEATSRSQKGKRLADVHPALGALTEDSFSDADPAAAAAESDVVFLALEHGASSGIAESVLAANPRVVLDLAADFRIADTALYQRYYGPHAAPSLLPRFCYGLADVAGSGLAGARAIAVPGCFATAAQLALFPLGSLGVPVDPALFAITGSSGAGAQPRPTTHHPARASNVFAYSVSGHRHEAEILQQWRRWTGRPDADVRLMTHSGPFVRGIYLSTHVRAPAGTFAGEQAPAALFARAYQGRPFIRLLEAPPELTHVVGTNDARIHALANADGSVLEIFVAIDNLIKGAAGQAVQAMNLALDLPETAGLRLAGAFPC